MRRGRAFALPLSASGSGADGAEDLPTSFLIDVFGRPIFGEASCIRGVTHGNAAVGRRGERSEFPVNELRASAVPPGEAKQGVLFGAIGDD